MQRAAVKLRNQGSKVYKLGVSIRTNYFKEADKQYNNFDVYDFIEATSDSRELIRGSKEVLKKIYRPGYNYKKAGVVLMDLIDTTAMQGVLFDESPYNADTEILMNTMDKLNNRMGRNTIILGAQGLEKRKKKWGMIRDHKSPSYATNWTQLMIVS